MNAPQTLYQKLFNQHVVVEREGELPLIYIDRHLIHEVTSPQAFSGLRQAQRRCRRPDLMMATMDHDISTQSLSFDACSTLAQTQIQALIDNTREFGVQLFGMGHEGQGIVHIIGPQTGFTLPGTTLVCGDSHTATHGAFGALAFGIGTSEVEHVMATQTLKQARLKNLEVYVSGRLPEGVFAKDLILAIAQTLTTAGGTGYAMEFRGPAIEALNMDERMTLCNMAIEVGAKCGLIAPDQTTFDYLKGRPFAPTGADWEEAIQDWKMLFTDEGAVFDKRLEIDASQLTPMATWGTNPGEGAPIVGRIPALSSMDNPIARHDAEQSLAYMDLEDDTPMQAIAIDTVFIGSCTNGRLHDFRQAARVLKGRRIKEGVRALAVPGSMAVKRQAEAEGLDRIFLEAGFEWRQPGCSMCLAMNDDKASPGSHVASTSNRNFVGRQGAKARTHLMSPASAAAAALAGHIVDPRQYW